jgi:hypothetical protein
MKTEFFGVKLDFQGVKKRHGVGKEFFCKKKKMIPLH